MSTTESSLKIPKPYLDMAEHPFFLPDIGANSFHDEHTPYGWCFIEHGDSQEQQTLNGVRSTTPMSHGDVPKRSRIRLEPLGLSLGSNRFTKLRRCGHVCYAYLENSHTRTNIQKGHPWTFMATWGKEWALGL